MSEDRGSKALGGKGVTAPRRPEDVTVLVVDDEPDVVTYLSSVLEDAGMRVLTARDGDEGLAILGSEKVDLVSLDLVMPRKSGIHFLVETRRHPEWSRIPIIFVTGHARDVTVRQSVEDALAGGTMTGPSTYLEKPVTPASYLEQVCRVLGVERSGQAGRALSEAEAAELKRRAARLLEGADAEALQALIDQLEKGQS